MKLVDKIANLPIYLSVVIALSASALAVNASEVELSGKVGVEQRYFSNDGQDSAQLANSQLSVFVEPEFYWSWNQGDDSVVFTPFYRFDEYDDERSHADIRELSYIHASDDWELRTGIRKEYWGVTEFQHLVDVINQTDGVEDFDGEDKLGQLMINLSLVRKWGIVDLYLLPGFRERTFSGRSGRLRSPLVVSNSDVSYQSNAEEHHLDFALRWSHTLGDFDIGSYWFHGTNRDPILTPTYHGQELTLSQYYNQMDQFGLDVQATIDDWLWKFETIYRTTDQEDYVAAQAGFEYTYVGVFESNVDLGLLVEYGWDSRGEASALVQSSNSQNDMYLGSRLAFNDIQSSEILMGIGADLDHNAYSFIIEGNRRFGDSVKASIDVRIMQSSNPYDLLYAIKDDDHVQMTIEWYY